MDSQWEFAVCLRELKPGLCDNLEGWDGVGGWEGGSRISRGRGHMYTYLSLIHVAVWQKPTQYCKAIILQLKMNKKQTHRKRDHN